MKTHVVLRQIETDEGVLEPGTQVDARQWRNTTRLVQARYLRPITAEEAVRTRAARSAKRKEQNGG